MFIAKTVPYFFLRVSSNLFDVIVNLVLALNYETSIQTGSFNVYNNGVLTIFIIFYVNIVKYSVPKKKC